MINRAYFDKVFLKAVSIVQEKFAPKDTGNLAYNAIKYRWIDKQTFEIYVDVGDTEAFINGEPYIAGQAPYMPFTNEEWISPRWNGKQNPNQNWWNKAIEYIIKYIAKRFKGELIKGEKK